MQQAVRAAMQSKRDAGGHGQELLVMFSRFSYVVNFISNFRMLSSTSYPHVLSRTTCSSTCCTKHSLFECCHQPYKYPHLSDRILYCCSRVVLRSALSLRCVAKHTWDTSLKLLVDNGEWRPTNCEEKILHKGVQTMCSFVLLPKW